MSNKQAIGEALSVPAPAEMMRTPYVVRLSTRRTKDKAARKRERQNRREARRRR